MSRPDPGLLQPERYPLRSELQVRFSDLDVNRHVNNVALVEMLQEARGDFHRASRIFDDNPGMQLMVANLSVQYLGEARHGVPIVCHTGLTEIGRTSQTIAQFATQDGAPVAFARTVMVSVRDGAPSPHSQAYRDKARTWLIEP